MWPAAGMDSPIGRRGVVTFGCVGRGSPRLEPPARDAHTGTVSGGAATRHLPGKAPGSGSWRHQRFDPGPLVPPWPPHDPERMRCPRVAERRLEHPSTDPVKRGRVATPQELRYRSVSLVYAPGARPLSAGVGRGPRPRRIDLAADPPRVPRGRDARALRPCGGNPNQMAGSLHYSRRYRHNLRRRLSGISSDSIAKVTEFLEPMPGGPAMVGGSSRSADGGRP
jgi:hypothetical protein